MDLVLKRVYDEPEPSDGTRILVDRLWPRGLTKERAQVDVWLKDLAPSTALRQWFHHELDKWPVFQQRYTAELQQHSEPLAVLTAALARGKVTLLFGARDEGHNEAVVIQAYIAAQGGVDEKP